MDPKATALILELLIGSQANQEFTMKEGILHKNGVIYVGSYGNLTQKLIEEAHSSAMGGHSRIQGTMKRLSGEIPKTVGFDTARFWQVTEFATAESIFEPVIRRGTIKYRSNSDTDRFSRVINLAASYLKIYALEVFRKELLLSQTIAVGRVRNRLETVVLCTRFSFTTTGFRVRLRKLPGILPIKFASVNHRVFKFFNFPNSTGIFAGQDPELVEYLA
ncbi:hypothetical protein JRO89_XS10G0051100 [Xanthoceras sorbifolium]|uniref:Uncharacterized protein n=1 Tax=Xanthoceras sorbifolium TaxID=99658 RepID=A0ABQ8HHQ9_9ROSI|nr:hypothetical protein JRO89_XS10G0051100 [Xanthoceras sorbifolium]